jgi:protein-disulfide isomerase
MAKDKKKESSDEVVINLDNLGVPIAIVVSGIIIAAAVFFATRNNTQVDTGTTEQLGDSIVQEDTFPEEAAEGTATLGDSVYFGNPDTATVAVIEYSDYLCGFCQRHFDETFPSIMENYVDTGDVLYVFKKFPLSSPGELGFDIAEGGVCAYNLGDADTFLQYHDKGFSLSSRAQIISLASDIGIDEGEFATCLDENRYREEVSFTLEEGRAAGISGTPGFVVGSIGDDGTVDGQLIFGAYPYETFKEAIEGYL